MRRISDNALNERKSIQKKSQQGQSNLRKTPSVKIKRDNHRSGMTGSFKALGVFLTGITALSIPVQSYTSTSVDDDGAEKITAEQGILTVASVKGESTHFAIDGFEHGFGYDLVRSYANNLDKQVNLIAYGNEKEALEAVKSGEADMALTTASMKLQSELSLASVNLSCGRDARLTKNGLHPNVNWSFADSNTNLAQSASAYVCDNNQSEYTDKLARFYNQNLLKDSYNKTHFVKAMNERLPYYQSAFKTVADTYNHDWELLVAIGYQESHLKANARSPTGVKGLMMLTRDTAREMGVANRVDPRQSINGGARYLEKMKASFADVPKSDRVFFALAAYNMGPNAVKGIQMKLRSQGKNDKSWTNVYGYMSKNVRSNSRYAQCMHYVRNIRSYLETMKKQDQKNA